MKTIPKDLDIVLTGRDAPKEIVEIADVVTEMKIKKYPEKMINKKGITYQLLFL